MAINVPAKLAILGPGAMVAAPISGPLQTILENTNHLYWKHRPAWISHAVSGDKSAGTLEYVIPVPPSSQDGVRYGFKIVLQAGAVGTVTVALAETNTNDTTTCVWSTITTSAGFALVNGFAVLSTTQSVATDTTMIRVRLTVATTACRVCHVYACPEPSSGAVPLTGGGVMSSGFRVVDDTLLTVAGSPVTQELVNRAHINTVATLQDRAQVVASLLCPLDRTGVTLTAPQTWTAAAGAGFSGWVVVGRVKAKIPDTTADQVVNVRVLASLTGGGATADLVDVQVTGQGQPQALLFAADAVANVGWVTITPQADGWIDVRVRVRSMAGQNVYVHAVTLDWTPLQLVDATKLLTGTGYHTPASAGLLSTAAQVVLKRSMQEYCAVGHMVDCASASARYTMQAHVSVPRGVAGLRLANYRTSSFGGGTGTVTTLAGSTDGSIATPADSVQVLGTIVGGDVYWDCNAAGYHATQLELSGTTFDATPAGSGYVNRQLLVTEDLVTSVEKVQIDRSSGWCLFPERKTADLSTL